MKTESQNYIFEISAYDINHLLPQVSKALEKRTENISREHFPGMWHHTDRLNNMTQRNHRNPFRTKILSIVYLLAGTFLLIPGLAKPKELFVPLLAGMIAVLMGIIGLWRSRKNKKNPFDKSAELLLAGKDTITGEQMISVIFSGQGMTIPAENNHTEFISYNDFECVIETADTLLLVYGTRVTVLQKQDLTAGNLQELSNLLSAKVALYQSI